MGPEIVQITIDKIRLIWDQLKTGQSRQKTYVDSHYREVEFSVGDHVFLKVSPMKGVMSFGKKNKLNPRFIGPFEILERIAPVAYRLALPPSLSKVHDVFHVSRLKKYVPNPAHALEYIPRQIQEDLSYEEVSVKILDQKEQVLCNHSIG